MEFTDIKRFKSAKFIILRSAIEDDIHKALKYGVWTSTSSHNRELDRAFRSHNDVILFFRVARENKLLGVARMKSGVEWDKMEKFWWHGTKWKGVF